MATYDELAAAGRKRWPAPSALPAATTNRAKKASQSALAAANQPLQDALPSAPVLSLDASNPAHANLPPSASQAGLLKGPLMQMNTGPERHLSIPSGGGMPMPMSQASAMMVPPSPVTTPELPSRPNPALANMPPAASQAGMLNGPLSRVGFASNGQPGAQTLPEALQQVFGAGRFAEPSQPSQPGVGQQIAQTAAQLEPAGGRPNPAVAPVQPFLDASTISPSSTEGQSMPARVGAKARAALGGAVAAVTAPGRALIPAIGGAVSAVNQGVGDFARSLAGVELPTRSAGTSALAGQPGALGGAPGSDQVASAAGAAPPTQQANAQAPAAGAPAQSLETKPDPKSKRSKAAEDIFLANNRQDASPTGVNARNPVAIPNSSAAYAGDYGGLPVGRTGNSFEPIGGGLPQSPDAIAQRDQAEAQRAAQARADYAANTTGSDGRRYFGSGEGAATKTGNVNEQLRQAQLETVRGERGPMTPGTGPLIDQQLLEEGLPQQARAAYRKDPLAAYAIDQKLSAEEAQARAAAQVLGLRDLRSQQRLSGTFEREGRMARDKALSLTNTQLNGLLTDGGAPPVAITALRDQIMSGFDSGLPPEQAYSQAISLVPQIKNDQGKDSGQYDWNAYLNNMTKKAQAAGGGNVLPGVAAGFGL